MSEKQKLHDDEVTVVIREFGGSTHAESGVAKPERLSYSQERCFPIAR